MAPRLRHPQRTRERYTDWRARCLRDAGFERLTADLVGRDSRFDLPALLLLVERGCPPDLAVRIMAPLDREELPS